MAARPLPHPHPRGAACGKPLIIHTRSASDDTLAILREEGEDGTSNQAGGVFHCFTESMQVARAALDLGYYISFSGIVTFKSAQELRDVVAFVPLDRMLIETDSPTWPRCPTVARPTTLRMCPMWPGRWPRPRA